MAQTTRSDQQADNLSARRALDEPLLRADDVAALLQVRKSSVYEYARSGMLPCLRVGGHVRFLRSDLEEWDRSRRQPT